MAKVGRPLKYETAEDLENAIDTYFKESLQTRETESGIKYINPPTVSGLAYHLGFESRQSMYDYKEREEFNKVLGDALNIIRSISPQRKLGIKYKNASQYALEKYHKDPITNIRTNINSQLRYALKNETATSSYLPYTLNELKEHPESLFVDGMSWDNMNEWHIDHIKPVSSFNFNSVDCEDFKKCYALDNLQPLWAKDNLKKGNYYIENTN